MPAARFVFALSLLLAPLAAQATEASFDRSLAAVHTKMASGKVKSFNPRSDIVKIIRRGVLATPAIPSLTAANQLSRFSWSRSCCRGHWT